MDEKAYDGKGGKYPAAGRQNGDMTAEMHQFWTQDHAMTAETTIDSSRSLQKSPYGQVDIKKEPSK